MLDNEMMTDLNVEKPKEVDPQWSTFRELVHEGGGQWMTQLYHYAGAFLAFCSHKLRVSPNQVTLLSGILVFAAMWVMLVCPLGNVLAALLVSGLMALAYALDCADGQLARATNQCSKYGAWLDHVVDAGKIFVVNFSVGWLLLKNTDIHGLTDLQCFLAMAVNIAGAALYFFAWNYKVMIAGQGLILRLADKEEKSRMQLFQVTQQFTDYGWFPLIFVLLFDLQKFALIYALYGIGTFAIFMAYILISARYMAKLKD